jgi:hypothetical protein
MENIHALIKELWLATLNRNKKDVGTKRVINLTLNIDGVDIVDWDFLSPYHKMRTIKGDTFSSGVLPVDFYPTLTHNI